MTYGHESCDQSDEGGTMTLNESGELVVKSSKKGELSKKLLPNDKNNYSKAGDECRSKYHLNGQLITVIKF